MKPEPKELTWHGSRRWACPLCPYDSQAFNDVAGHIDTRHEGQAVPDYIEPKLSVVPEPISVEEGFQFPLVSCVMPTRNRSGFVRQSIKHFVAQTYPNKELIIVADGEDLASIIQTVDPAENIRLFQLPGDGGVTVGYKRNYGVMCSTGQFIANWDDDEWQSPNRLCEQWRAMRDDVMLVGIGQPIFMDTETAVLYWFSAPRPHRGYCSGSSMFYRRSLWERVKFPDVNIGEDTMFLQEVDARAVAHVSPGLNVSFVHSGNTVSKRITEAPYIALKQRL